MRQVLDQIFGGVATAAVVYIAHRVGSAARSLRRFFVVELPEMRTSNKDVLKAVESLERSSARLERTALHLARAQTAGRRGS